MVMAIWVMAIWVMAIYGDDNIGDGNMVMAILRDSLCFGLNVDQFNVSRAANGPRPVLKPVMHGHEIRVSLAAQKVARQPASFALPAIYENSVSVSGYFVLETGFQLFKREISGSRDVTFCKLPLRSNVNDHKR